MAKNILAIVGFILSFYLIKHRESIGNSFGEYDWMKYFGGIYGIVVIMGIFIFFWSLATITGTEDTFLYPFMRLIPFATLRETPPPPDIF